MPLITMHMTQYIPVNMNAYIPPWFSSGLWLRDNRANRRPSA